VFLILITSEERTMTNGELELNTLGQQEYIL